MADLPPGYTLDPQPDQTPSAGPQLPPGYQLDNSSLAPQDTSYPTMALNALRRVGYGLSAPAIDLGRLATHAASAAFPNSPLAQSANSGMENYYGQREQDYQKIAPTTGPDWLATAGEILGSAPLAYAVPGSGAASLAARIGSGVVGGALSGALTPVPANSQDYWGDVQQNALGGAVGGAAVPAAFGAVGGIVSPSASTSKAVQTLRNLGVDPTVGQMSAPWINRLEQGVESTPLFGDIIRNSKRAVGEQFANGLINNILEPIGEKLAPDAKELTAKIADMQAKSSAFWSKLVPQLGVPTAEVDPVANGILHDGLASVKAAALEMPPDRQQQLLSMIKARIEDRMSEGGGLTGQTWHDADSFFNRMANNPRNGLIHSSDPDQNQLGEALNGVRTVLMNAVRASDPAAEPALNTAKLMYSRQKILETAAANAAKTNDPNVINPTQYMNSVAGHATQAQLAAGRARQQDIATAAKQVLGSTVPDSGTPYRQAVKLALGALAAGGLGHEIPGVGGLVGTYAPMAIGAGAGLAGLEGLAYSPYGRAALGTMMAARPPFAAPVAAGIRGLAPAGAAAAGPLFGALAP